MVACYDAKSKVVMRTLPGECAGEVVDEERAAEIAAERAARVRQAAVGMVPSPAGRRSVGTGTGFFVNEDGEILTDRHVVATCGAVTAKASEGPERPVAVVALDAAHDLALLRGARQPPAFASFNPQPGAALDLALVGFPERVVEPTATPVFAPVERLSEADYYLFHGDVRHGHSGGPILDDSGRVIGVARAMVDTVQTYRATGKRITEVGVAMSNRAVLGFLDDNHVRHGTAAMATNTDRLAQARRFLVHLRCWR